MRRRTVHAVFAVIAVGCATVAASQAVHLLQARRVNASIVTAAAISNAAAANAGTADTGTADSSVPEAQFARALALSRAGDPDAALKAYKILVQGKRQDLRVAALYNIGNLHMRQAWRQGAEDPTQLLPLVELAKQSYRDVLRAQPENWDARYNLERALQIAPEAEDVPVDDEEKEAPEEHVSSTLQGAKMDLP